MKETVTSVPSHRTSRFASIHRTILQKALQALDQPKRK